MQDRLPGDAPALPTGDVLLLLVAIELHDRYIAAEIARMRAVGLTLRSAALPLFLGALVALAELFVTSDNWTAVPWAGLLFFCALAVVRQGAILRRWAASKTFEAFHWIQVGGAAARVEEPDLPTEKIDDIHVGA